MSRLTLASFWHPIATADEIRHTPGQFTLLGEKLVAFRDASGVVVFKDLCVHRGTALSRGCIRDGRLVCPYHGWEYDRTGRCVHIPSLPTGTPIPKKAQAITYEAQEMYGLVWVALDEPGQPIPAWPEAAWDNPRYRVCLAGVYEWRASAARVIDNAMDLAHFNFVHKGYTELADGPVIKHYDVTETGDFGLEYAYEDGHLRREYTLCGPFTLHDKKCVIGLGTGSTWSDAGEPQEGDNTILTFIVAPVEETFTRIYAFVARNHTLNVDDKAFTAGFDTIMEQDRVIVESQRPEQIPTDIREEVHMGVPDAAGIAYRRLLARLRLADTQMP